MTVTTTKENKEDKKYNVVYAENYSCAMQHKMSKCLGSQNLCYDNHRNFQHYQECSFQGYQDSIVIPDAASTQVLINFSNIEKLKVDHETNNNTRDTIRRTEA